MANKKNQKLVVILLLLIGVLNANAKADDITDIWVTTDTLQVFFRQDKIDLNPQFRNNGNRLKEFTNHFKALLADSTSKVKSIVIVSGASPEGPHTRNRYLSDNRAKVVYDYLTENNLVDSTHISIESRGTDWKGLANFISESDLPYRDEALELLNFPLWITEKNKVVDGRKRRMMELNGGDAWRELYDLYFADLRTTKVMIVWNIQKPQKTDTIIEYPLIPSLDTISVCQPPLDDPCLTLKIPPKFQTTENQSVKPSLYLAIKSNLLFDSFVIPNIGAEIGIYKGLTISGSYYNIWLRDKAWTSWYRFEGFEAGVNWYFNKENRPFKGHHIGIYGQLVTWDFTINGRGYLAERWAYGGGISYGYILPIGKRFNLDFEIGIGYLGGNMHKYIPEDGHRVWQSYEPFHWIGPTKLGITLQWLIGRGNHNGRKEVDER